MKLTGVKDKKVVQSVANSYLSVVSLLTAEYYDAVLIEHC